MLLFSHSFLTQNMAHSSPSPPKVSYLCILDFEATCSHDPQWVDEIIEFPVVVLKLLAGGESQVVAEFERIVKPRLNPILTSFCTSLTGITQEMVDAGAEIESVLCDFEKFLVENVGLVLSPPESVDTPFLFVTCGDWDLRTMLPKQLNLLGSYFLVSAHLF